MDLLKKLSSFPFGDTYESPAGYVANLASQAALSYVISRYAFGRSAKFSLLMGVGVIAFYNFAPRFLANSTPGAGSTQVPITG